MSDHQLGEQIKKARERQGLTQDQLAAKADLSRIYIAKIEGAERETPSLTVLEAIADALGMELRVRLAPKRQATPQQPAKGRKGR